MVETPRVPPEISAALCSISGVRVRGYGSVVSCVSAPGSKYITKCQANHMRSGSDKDCDMCLKRWKCYMHNACRFSLIRE